MEAKKKIYIYFQFFSSRFCIVESVQIELSISYVIVVQKKVLVEIESSKFSFEALKTFLNNYDVRNRKLSISW